MDEFQLEVAPLGSDDTARVSSLAPDSDGPVPIAPRPPRWRQRLRHAGAVAAILAVVLTGALIIAISPGSRGELSTLVFGTPTPTAPVPFGADILYFEHVVPWVTTWPTIDGKPVPLLLETNSETFVRVARGRHMLTYNAPPFAPLRCVFSVPAAKGDTCPLGGQGDLDLGGTVKLARVIDLGGMPTKLPADQLAALGGAVRATVDVPEQVVPVRVGEQYMTDAGVQTATQPLNATLVFELQRDDSAGCDVIERCNGDCAYLCVPANAGASPNGVPQAWSLESHITAGWRYTTADGTPVTSDLVTLTAGLPGVFGPPFSRMLVVKWDGSWQLYDEIWAQITSPGNPTCALGRGISVSPTQGAPDGTHFASDTTASLPTPSDGCVIRVEQVADQGDATLASVVLLYRFGVLLTLDDAGHALLPSLPEADTYERSLASPVVATLPPLAPIPPA